MSKTAIHTGSRLYQIVADMQGDRPWGNFLDAGTGKGSLRWLLTLDTERWTAITASSGMAEQVTRELGDQKRPEDRLLVGNWSDPEFLQSERFDTVLADYLLGAIDGFAPYTQDQLFSRLRPLTGQRLYIIGLEPYVPYSSTDPAGKLIVEIGRLRDACLLLAGERPYREYPMDWVLRHLRQSGYRCVDAQRFGIRYGDSFIHGQLDMCDGRLRRLKDRNLAMALSEHVQALRQQALALNQTLGGLRHGHDYVICAEAI